MPGTHGLFFSSPSVPGAVGSLALSTLTVNLTLTPTLVLASALALAPMQSYEFSQSERYRTSKIWALLGLPWHAFSSPGVPGAVGSLVLSVLTLNLSLTLALSLALTQTKKYRFPCCSSIFLIWKTHRIGWIRASARAGASTRAGVRVRFTVERAKEPTGTLGLEKACQSNPSKALCEHKNWTYI